MCVGDVCKLWCVPVCVSKALSRCLRLRCVRVCVCLCVCGFCTSVFVCLGVYGRVSEVFSEWRERVCVSVVKYEVLSESVAMKEGH